MNKTKMEQKKIEDSDEELEDLDVDQILKIYKDVGIYQKTKDEKKDIKLYDGIYCQSSFYIFHFSSPIRVFCYKMWKKPWWETIVMVLIFLSSLKLAIDTYERKVNVKYRATYIYVSLNIDKTFNILFIIEMSVKLIAMGFCMDEGTYLRETWN